MASAWDGIAVVGAGISGLAAANALADAGIPVRVYEQASALGEVGAGVAITPNSLRILDRLGLTQRVSEIEPRLLPGMAIYTSQGERLGFVDSPEGARNLHRADLLDLFSSRLKPDTIRLNSKLVSVEEADERVLLRFADGRLETAVAVIGADGIHSAIRPFVVEESRPVFSGMVAYRGLVATERVSDWPQDEVKMFAGAGRHFLVFPVRRGTLLNFVGFVAAGAEMRESWSAPGDPAMLAVEFAGWHEPVRRFISQIQTTFQWGLYDREPLPTWVRGRIALAGDAAHAMLPHAGQGANQCIEDAAALAEVLRGRPLAEVAGAFLDYDRARRERASFVQRFSRRLGLEYDGRHTEIRDTARLADKGQVYGWIFGHDSIENARQVRAGRASAPLPAGAPV